MSDGPRDPIGLALGAIGAGATAGAAVVTTATVIVRLRPADETGDVAFGILTGGALLGVVMAVACVFAATTPIADRWPRAVAAAIAAFLAVLLGAVSAPADRLAGRVGLFIYLLLLIGTSVALWRRSTRDDPAP